MNAKFRFHYREKQKDGSYSAPATFDEPISETVTITLEPVQIPEGFGEIGPDEQITFVELILTEET